MKEIGKAIVHAVISVLLAGLAIMTIVILASVLFQLT